MKKLWDLGMKKSSYTWHQKHSALKFFGKLGFIKILNVYSARNSIMRVIKTS